MSFSVVGQKKGPDIGESSSASTQAPGELNQYLTLLVGKEEYGIDILRVQGIKVFGAVTAVPNTPPYVKGVMNLRGIIIPVIDLRVKFNLPDPQYTKTTVIVMVSLRNKVVGLVVDAVSDVVDIARAAVEVPPELVSDSETTFITGMATVAERLIMLMDVDQIISPDSLPDA